jgi:tetratricopeptide (TPR) repeat protein
MIRILFFVIALISMIIMVYLDVSIIVSFVITLIILIIFNYITGIILASLQRKALNLDCDPERFLEMMDNHEKRRGKEPRIASRIAINRAAGHISLGNFLTAKEYLEGIDTSYLSEKDGSLFVYTINLILCHYELNEIEKAEYLYETNLVKLSPLGKRLQKSVEILIGERYYYLGKYDLSYEHLNQLLTPDLDKRQYLCVMFRLAQMEIMTGETERAIKKLKKIEKLGNKLWIVRSSVEILERIAKEQPHNNFEA